MLGRRLLQHGSSSTVTARPKPNRELLYAKMKNLIIGHIMPRHFKNINLTLKDAAVGVKHVKDLKFDNVTINGVAYPGEQPTTGN